MFIRYLPTDQIYTELGATYVGDAKVYPNGKNSCRFDIWTNLPGDKNDGRITADVPYGLMYVFLQLIQHYTEPSTPSDSSYIQIEGFTFYGGKRSDKPEVLAKLFAGKDEQGVIYISVQVADSSRPKIRFPLMDQFYSKIITQQGPMAKPLASANVILLGPTAMFISPVFCQQCV